MRAFPFRKQPNRNAPTHSHGNSAKPIRLQSDLRLAGLPLPGPSLQQRNQIGLVKIPFTIDWDALELNSESSKPTSTGCPRGLRGWTQLPSAHTACVEISQLSFVSVHLAARAKRCIIIPVWGLGGQSCVARLALLASLHVLWPHRQAIAGRKESDSATLDVSIVYRWRSCEFAGTLWPSGWGVGLLGRLGPHVVSNPTGVVLIPNRSPAIREVVTPRFVCATAQQKKQR